MAKEAFVGKAGQLAGMAEFLLRGYNVAIPEVDVGDDVLVVNNQAEDLWRIQAKTALGVARGYGYSGQFLVSLAQLRQRCFTPLYYLFTLWTPHGWEFVPIAQTDLLREYRQFQVGSQAGANVLFYLAFREGSLICSGRDWQAYRNNWTPWPIIPS
jgi:hypothetical protein